MVARVAPEIQGLRPAAEGNVQNEGRVAPEIAPQQENMKTSMFPDGKQIDVPKLKAMLESQLGTYSAKKGQACFCPYVMDYEEGARTIKSRLDEAGIYHVQAEAAGTVCLACCPCNFKDFVVDYSEHQFTVETFAERRMSSQTFLWSENKTTMVGNAHETQKSTTTKYETCAQSYTKVLAKRLEGDGPPQTMVEYTEDGQRMVVTHNRHCCCGCYMPWAMPCKPRSVFKKKAAEAQ